MAHEKVYGICDSKCRVEVMPKSQAFGITKVTKDDSSHGTYTRYLPESGEKLVFPYPVEKMNIDIPLGMVLDDNYYSEIVVRKKNPNAAVHPQYFLNCSYAKFLNKDLAITDFDVLHYHFTYDGINLCCWCSGYTDPVIVG